MTSSVKLPECTYSLAVRIPNNHSQSMRTRCKVAICVGTVLGTLGIGIGIGYLIASKRLENSLCLENPITIDPYDFCYTKICKPWFEFMQCISKAVPNFSALQNHPCSIPEYCDP